MHSITLNNLTTNQIAAIIAALGNDSYPQHAAPAPVPATADFPAECASLPDIGAVLAALNDPRYTLRTAGALCTAGGYHTEGALLDDLVAKNVAFIAQRRRSDGATLIGLISRN